MHGSSPLLSPQMGPVAPIGGAPRQIETLGTVSPVAEIGQIGRTQIIETLTERHAADLYQVAPDMRDISHEYAGALFATLQRSPAFPLELARHQVGLTAEDGVISGLRRSGEVFYRDLGQVAFGPLSVHFVRAVLDQAPERSTVAFPARDGELFFEIAKILCEDPVLAQKELMLTYPTVNRKTLGTDDEMSADHEALRGTDDPLVVRYLRQEAFFNPNGVVVADVGCWGTMVDALLQAHGKGNFPINLKGVHFLFSHLDQISGYMNILAQSSPDITEKHLEAIADTFEALPRFVTRSTGYRESEGVVVPDYDGHTVDSPFLEAWHQALLEGGRVAAREFLTDPLSFPSPNVALMLLQSRHLAAQAGAFTGVFGHNTPTWSKGDEWRASWRWGNIAPIGEA
ncbi:MAG: hypothetical protein J0M12_06425 [Deltaproteobacteria bacterium]|nr:hypothetical protein [Deltaproteobacteria bacterium]